MLADQRAQMTAGQFPARLVRRRPLALAVDMPDGDGIAGGKRLFQRFVELPVLARPRRDGGFIVHGGMIAGIGAGGE